MIIDDYREINSNLLMLTKDTQNIDVCLDKVFNIYNTLINDDEWKKRLPEIKERLKDAITALDKADLRQDFLEYYHTVSKSEKNIALSTNKFSKYDSAYYDTYKSRYVYDSIVNLLTETGIDKVVYNSNEEVKRYVTKKVVTLITEIQAGKTKSIEAVSNVIPNTIFPLFLDQARVIVNNNPHNNAGAYTDGENIFIDVSFLLHYGPFDKTVSNKFNLDPYPLNGYSILKNIVFHEIGHLLFDDTNYTYGIAGNILRNKPFESYKQLYATIQDMITKEPNIRDIVNINFVNNMFLMNNILSDITINNLLVYKFDRLSFQKTAVPIYNKPETISLPLGVYLSKTNEYFNHFKAFERYIELAKQFVNYLFQNKTFNCGDMLNNIVKYVKSNKKKFAITDEHLFRKSMIDIIMDKFFQKSNFMILQSLKKEFNLNNINIIRNNESSLTLDQLIKNIYEDILKQFQMGQSNSMGNSQGVGKALEGLRFKQSSGSQNQSNSKNQDQSNNTDKNMGNNTTNNDKTQQDDQQSVNNSFDSNDEANLVKKAKEEMSKALDKAAQTGKYENKSNLGKVETRNRSKQNSDIKTCEKITKARASSIIEKANIMQHGKGVGTDHIIDCVRAIIDSLNKYDIEWDKLLKNLLYSKYYSDLIDAKKEDYSNPNIPLVGVKNNIEATLGTQTYIPSEKYIRPGYFLAVVDVSGSVSVDVEKAFLSELYGLLETSKKDGFNLYLDILYVDTDKCDRSSYTSLYPEQLKDDITKVGVPQGGGTYLSAPLFNTVAELSKNDEDNKKLKNLSTLLVLTDGYLSENDINNFKTDVLRNNVFKYSVEAMNASDDIRDRIVYIISDEDSDMYNIIKNNYKEYGRNCIIAKEKEKNEYVFVDVAEEMSF